jgi:photosystem II stability/assembly factor-like uncharacterized protein
MKLVLMLLTLVLSFFLITSFAQQPDSKSSWQLQESNTKARLRAVSAVNDKVVWASGTQGTFVKTIDGGKSWVAATVTGAEDLDFRDIQAFDEKTAVLLSIGEGEKSRIYKTVDGGKNWQMLYKNPNPKAFFDGIAFWDKNHAIAFSDPVDGYFLVITTKDGGKNWQTVPKEKIPAAIMGEAAFAASGTSILVKGKQQVWIATGGTTARVFSSINGGESWTVADCPIISGKDSAGIFSLVFKDSKNGVVVGGDYKEENKAEKNIALTTDGGKTWKAVETQNLTAPLLSHPSGYRSCVVYAQSAKQPKKDLFLAVGPNGSDYSLDNAKSWQNISQEGFHSASASKSFIWAVGENGKIGKLDFSNLLH